MEYRNPPNAGLVLPFQRPRDRRSTLPVLPRNARDVRPAARPYHSKRRVGSPWTWNVAFQQQQQFICDGNLL
jgi:hypothetical protein